ncbi:MAG: DUF6754 domain-containing protein [Candidatus Zixiibacteriota bacterium]
MTDRYRPLLTPPVALFLFALAISPATFAQNPEPNPSDSALISAVGSSLMTGPRPAVILSGGDRDNDDGGEIRLTWQLSPDDIKGGIVTGYKVLKASEPGGPFVEVGDMAPGTSQLEGGETDDGRPYYFKVITLSMVPSGNGALVEVSSESEIYGPIVSSAQWFHMGRLNVFVGSVLVVFLILFMIRKARSGRELYVRKIAGLDAVDEAIGRATEMGKKVIYVPGIDDMDNVMTIASMIILGYVAEMTATYDTYLEVPVSKSMVMVTAKEVVKEAYTKVGRADSYKMDQVHYLTDDQFGYAAAIDGIVVREKPATMFYIGSFFAESLILAEIGNAAGAIQIAGTAQPTQLPFFVTACDYTLLGEEMFAASAYLSKEPRLLGSLKGQDYVKAVILVLVVIGIILETFGVWDFSRLFTVV